MWNILTIWPIRDFDFLIKAFWDWVKSSDNIADIWSWSSDFPEVLLDKWVKTIYAVDRTYRDIDYFSWIVKTSIEVLLDSIEKNSRLLEEYEIDNIKQRIELLKKSPEIIFSRDSIINLTSIDDLPNDFFDKLFLSNMLLWVDDIWNFLSNLWVKLNKNWKIYISEYSWNIAKIGYLKSLIDKWVEYKWDYLWVCYFIVNKNFFWHTNKKD